MTFKLTGETDGIFQIQPDGLLYHNRSLDRETRAVHRLQVNWDQKKKSNSNFAEPPLCWEYHWLLPSSFAEDPVRALPTLMAYIENFICLFFSFFFSFYQLQRVIAKIPSSLGFLTKVTQFTLSRPSDGITCPSMAMFRQLDQNQANNALIYHWYLLMAVVWALDPQRRQH